MHEEALKELGLTDNETRIYLLLLSQGIRNPSEISKALGLHRGYVYDALQRMQEKEVVSSLLVNNKQHFQATSPERIVSLLKMRMEHFQSIVPALIGMVTLEKEDTTVELHRGKRVYRVLLNDMIASLPKNDEAYLIGIDEEVLLKEVEPLYLKRYLAFIKTKNIREKIIIKKGAKQLSHNYLVYRTLDEQYLGKTSQIVYANKVALFILGTPYYLIIITNKAVAETYKRQFHLLWNMAKDI